MGSNKDPFSSGNLVFLVPDFSVPHIVSQEGIQMETRKVSAITNWPQPKTLKQVQRFLGFAKFYRRFIHNFSTIAAPISALTKGSPTRIQWTDEALESF